MEYSHPRKAVTPKSSPWHTDWKVQVHLAFLNRDVSPWDPLRLRLGRDVKSLAFTVRHRHRQGGLPSASASGENTDSVSKCQPLLGLTNSLMCPLRDSRNQYWVKEGERDGGIQSIFLGLLFSFPLCDPEWISLAFSSKRQWITEMNLQDPVCKAFLPIFNYPKVKRVQGTLQVS